MSKRLRVALLGTLVVPMLACSDVLGKLCDDPAEPAFVTTQAPDWEGEVEASADFPFLGVTSGTLNVQVWDCVDPSWVGDVPQQKVVQVFVNDTYCDYADAVLIETAPCDSTETADIYYRDMDGDGASASEGDPDDTNPTLQANASDDDQDSGAHSGVDSGRNVSAF
jgi:hypothetical protein